MIRHLFKYPLRAFDGLADRLVSVIGAIGSSQAPGFVTHYLQRLGGHVSEARLNVASWQAIANEASGGSLQQLIDLYTASDAAEVVQAGQKCAADIGRLHHLQDALTVIGDAPAWSRLFTFVRHADAAIAHETLAGYVPNVPLDLEGLIYALCGLAVGFSLYQGTKGLVRLALRRRRARKLGRRKHGKGGEHAPGKSGNVGGLRQGDGAVAVDGDIRGDGEGDRQA